MESHLTEHTPSGTDLFFVEAKSIHQYIVNTHMTNWRSESKMLNYERDRAQMLMIHGSVRSRRVFEIERCFVHAISRQKLQ